MQYIFFLVFVSNLLEKFETDISKLDFPPIHLPCLAFNLMDGILESPSSQIQFTSFVSFSLFKKLLLLCMNYKNMKTCLMHLKVYFFPSKMPGNTYAKPCPINRICTPNLSNLQYVCHIFSFTPSKLCLNHVSSRSWTCD